MFTILLIASVCAYLSTGVVHSIWTFRMMKEDDRGWSWLDDYERDKLVTLGATVLLVLSWPRIFMRE